MCVQIAQSLQRNGQAFFEFEGTGKGGREGGREAGSTWMFSTKTFLETSTTVAVVKIALHPVEGRKEGTAFVVHFLSFVRCVKRASKGIKRKMHF